MSILPLVDLRLECDSDGQLTRAWAADSIQWTLSSFGTSPSHRNVCCIPGFHLAKTRIWAASVSPEGEWSKSGTRGSEHWMIKDVEILRPNIQGKMLREIES